MLKIAQFSLSTSEIVNTRFVFQKLFKSTVPSSSKSNNKIQRLTKASTTNVTNSKMDSTICNNISIGGSAAGEFANMNESGSMKEKDAYSPYRYWENTQLGNQLKNTNPESIIQHGLPFTLLSYNILAQDLLEEHSHLYKHNQPEALDWKFRIQRLCAEILVIRPHIVCLQEVQEDHLTDLIDGLTGLNLDYVFKKKTGFRTDGCAIFYNRDVFKLKNYESVEYFQPDVFPLDRHNIGLLAKFSLKSNPHANFILSTTHLMYNPKRQDVRLAQIQVLLAELDRFSVAQLPNNSNPPTRSPIILTGDFNLLPYSAPYTLLTKGKLQYECLSKRSLEFVSKKSYEEVLGKEFLPSHLGITDNCQHIDLDSNQCSASTRLFHSTNNAETSPKEDLLVQHPRQFSTGILSHDLNLNSVYSHRRDNQMTGTTYQDEWINVDYIFYSKYFSPKINHLCEGYLKLLSKYVLPSVSQCNQIGNIPNHDYGSDHFCLAAKFYLKYPGGRMSANGCV